MYFVIFLLKQESIQAQIQGPWLNWGLVTLMIIFFISIHVCFGGKKKQQQQKKYARSREGKKAKILFEQDISGHRLLAANVEVCLLATLKVSISLSWRPAAVIKAIFEPKAVGEGEDKTYLFQVWNRQLSLPYQGFLVL